MSNLISQIKEFVFTFFTLNLTSLNFFATLFAILLAYYVFPKKHRWIVILCANILFVYAISRKKSLVVMTAMLFSVWLAARLFEKFCEHEKLKKAILILTLCFNAGLLVLLKDAVFFTNLFHIPAEKAHIPFFQRLAPIGISYWCLSSISYLLDCYWGTINAERNFAKFAAVAGFFPLLVSGPIIRFGETASQIIEGNKFNYENFCAGLQRFFWGLFKELILAERLAVIVKTIYDGGTASQMGTVTFEGFYIPLGGFCYVMQVYTNFSGCMDIVLGTTQMFGIKLPENFQTPFYSTSLSEFWRRWHITLGGWVRDYIMYPVQKTLTAKFGKIAKEKLGKQHGKNFILYSAMFATWFTVGFWHGGTWKYIFGSGLFFFAMIVGGLILQPFFLWLIKTLHINTQTQSWILFQRIRTALLFTLSVSFGRAASLKYGLKMWSQVFKYNPWIFVDGSLFKLGLDAKDFFVLIFGMMILFVVSKKQQQGSVREIIAKQNLIFRWILWLGLFAAVLLFGMYGEGYNPAEFIYGGF